MVGTSRSGPQGCFVRAAAIGYCSSQTFSVLPRRLAANTLSSHSQTSWPHHSRPGLSAESGSLVIFLRLLNPALPASLRSLPRCFPCLPAGYFRCEGGSDGKRPRSSTPPLVTLQ